VVIAVAEPGGARLVVPRAFLVGEEVNALRRRLGETLADGVSRVVVDLRAVRYISAHALGVLVTFLVELRQRGGDLALLGCPSHLRELFALCGLDEIFQFLEPRSGRRRRSPRG